MEQIISQEDADQTTMTEVCFYLCVYYIMFVCILFLPVTYWRMKVFKRALEKRRKIQVDFFRLNVRRVLWSHQVWDLDVVVQRHGVTTTLDKLPGKYYCGKSSCSLPDPGDEKPWL